MRDSALSVRGLRPRPSGPVQRGCLRVPSLSLLTYLLLSNDYFLREDAGKRVAHSEEDDEPQNHG